MQRRRLEENQANRKLGYRFREEKYSFSLTEEGVDYTEEETGEKGLLPYSAVKFYRATSRSSASARGKEKLYMTVPVSFPCNYNHYCFKADGVTYLTHEFSESERLRIELAISEYSIHVTDRRTGALAVMRSCKNFSEDGGLVKRIVAISISVLGALFLGAVIAFLLNYFLHTDTGSLALVFGIFCLPCLAIVLVKAQKLGSRVKIFDKGVYIKIRGRSGEIEDSPFAIQKAFLHWGEIESVERVQSQVQYYVKFRLGYCVYAVPDFNGLYEYIARNFPEKCKVGA